MGGYLVLTLQPELRAFRTSGSISAKDFNAIPDKEGDTILWGEGENAITKADGMGFMRDLNESDRTVMRDGTWLTEIFHDD